MKKILLTCSFLSLSLLGLRADASLLSEEAAKQGVTVQLRPKGCVCTSLKAVVTDVREGMTVVGGHLKEMDADLKKNRLFVDTLFSLLDAAGLKDNDTVKKARAAWKLVQSTSNFATLFVENGIFSFFLNDKTSGIDEVDDLKVLLITSSGNTPLSRFFAQWGAVFMPSDFVGGVGFTKAQNAQVFVLKLLSVLTQGASMSISAVDSAGMVSLGAGENTIKLNLIVPESAPFAGYVNRHRDLFLSVLRSGDLSQIATVSRSAASSPEGIVVVIPA